MMAALLSELLASRYYSPVLERLFRFENRMRKLSECLRVNIGAFVRIEVAFGPFLL
jgi:hypothetical protein